MWPASNPSGMYAPNQWSFNPALYQNIPTDQVDWATLAQQWIKMKETVGPPPPPPIISRPVSPDRQKDASVKNSKTTPTKNTENDEGGEAPMDMDTKEDETGTSWTDWSQWQSSQWGWGVWPAGGQPASSVIEPEKQAMRRRTSAATSFDLGIIPPVISPTDPSLQNIKWNKVKKSSSHKEAHAPSVMPYQVLDAVKKKQLPAWIREGLTKMEQEKQKRLNKEQRYGENRNSGFSVNGNEEDNESDIFNNREDSSKVRDSSYSTDVPPIKNEFIGNIDRDRSQSGSPRASKFETSVIRKTKDQIMEESMLKVRRILTKMLLDVTKVHTYAIAKEEIKRMRTRTAASAQQIRRSNALSAISGNLGLEAYDSESLSSDDEHEQANTLDSDEELKKTIDKKRKAFRKIEDEIDETIRIQEEKERLMIQQDEEDSEENDSENEDENKKNKLGNNDDREQESSEVARENSLIVPPVPVISNYQLKDKSSAAETEKDLSSGSSKPPKANITKRENTKELHKNDSNAKLANETRAKLASETRKETNESRVKLAIEMRANIESDVREKKEKRKRVSSSSSSSSSSSGSSSSSSSSDSSSESSSDSAKTKRKPSSRRRSESRTTRSQRSRSSDRYARSRSRSRTRRKRSSSYHRSSSTKRRRSRDVSRDRYSSRIGSSRNRDSERRYSERRHTSRSRSGRSSYSRR